MISVPRGLIDTRMDANSPDPSSMLSCSPPTLPVLAETSMQRQSMDQGRPPSIQQHVQSSEPAHHLSINSAQGSVSFAKIPVKKTAARPMASSLAKGLEASLLSRGSGSGQASSAFPSGGSLLSIDVYLTVGKPPQQCRIPSSSTVEEAIELIITASANKDLLPDPDYYELRMVDDDEGTPDTDIPPLGRGKMISQFNLDAVALCRVGGEPITQASNSNNNNSNSITTGNGSGMDRRLVRGPSLHLNKALGTTNRKFVRIHMPHHVSYVIPSKKGLTLEGILPLIAKKRAAEQEQLLAKDWKFVHLGQDEALGMNELVSVLDVEELQLTRRVALEADFFSHQDREEEEDKQQIILTHHQAHQYSEYHVVKTNQRGKKQKRVLGIDGQRIYNRNPDSMGVLGRKISMDVHRASRDIGDVSAIEKLPDPRCFRITFKQSNGDTRDYEADTKMERNLIVAKITYLIAERNK